MTHAGEKRGGAESWLPPQQRAQPLQTNSAPVPGAAIFPPTQSAGWANFPVLAASSSVFSQNAQNPPAVKPAPVPVAAPVEAPAAKHSATPNKAVEAMPPAKTNQTPFKPSNAFFSSKANPFAAASTPSPAEATKASQQTEQTKPAHVEPPSKKEAAQEDKKRPLATEGNASSSDAKKAKQDIPPIPQETNPSDLKEAMEQTLDDFRATFVANKSLSKTFHRLRGVVFNLKANTDGNLPFINLPVDPPRIL